MVNENQLTPYEATELPVERGPWLVFAPHADDESFGMGGTIAKAVQAGITVHLVVLTDGALGGESAGLAEIRKGEACKAALLLGMQTPVFLGFPDRGLRLDEKTVQQVNEEISRIQPTGVFFPGCFELHPDHRTTALVVWQALRTRQQKEIVPVSYEVLVQSPANILVDISPFIGLKNAAMSVYESQLSEKRYIDIATSLNKLRSLTLCGDISHAEAFYRFSSGAPDTEYEQVVFGILKAYFTV
jgi:LmbE family N-acetylglucosaminyl deacetylase